MNRTQYNYRKQINITPKEINPDAHKQTSEDIKQQTEAFLASGGKIEHVDSGSYQHIVLTPREHERLLKREV